MRNVPEHYRPKKWQDFYGHSSQIDRVKDWIRNAPESLPRSIFISGFSGVGKTSLVLLLIKSIHCLNRKPGEIDPCGRCASCLGVDARIGDRSMSNVHWVQPGGFNNETVQASVKAALAAASLGPINSENPNSSVLFVVLDEFDKIPTDVRSQLLIRSEVNTPFNVCYIFISMMAERLSMTDRVALTARSESINMLAMSPAAIKEYLIRTVKDPQLTEAGAEVLAKNSEGSLRMGLALYSAAKALHPVIDEATASESVQAATREQRRILWELLENESTSTLRIKEYIASLLTVVDRKKLLSQLQEDLLYNQADNDIEVLTVLNMCLLNLNSISTSLTFLRGKTRGIASELQREVDGGDRISELIAGA